jgi:hypothetical protein
MQQSEGELYDRFDDNNDDVIDRQNFQMLMNNGNGGGGNGTANFNFYK